MSQVTKYEIPGAPLSPANLASSLASLFGAAASFNREATAPSNPFEGMAWWDTSAAPVETFKRYTAAAGWVSFFSVNIVTGAVSFFVPDGMIAAAMLASGAVTADKIAANAIALSKLNAAVYASQAEAEGGTENTKLVTPLRVAQAIAALAQTQGVFGQCSLSKSGSNILLSPCNGNLLTIDGQARAIPSSGVALAPTGLTVGTNYYIYASWSGSAIALEASTTAHSLSSSSGLRVKSDDATRTLVGMVRPVAGPAFADTITQRFVLSWFNQRNKTGLGAFTSEKSVTSTSYVEVASEIRVEFLAWADETVRVDIRSAVKNTNSTGRVFTTIGIDNATPRDAVVMYEGGGYANGYYFPMTTCIEIGLSEGYHYATLLGRVGSGTGYWWYQDSTDRTTLGVTVKG